MTTDFDPYYKWLGIPPKDQPPHHYRLLGIELFETDREVIDAAANRLMGYLKDLAVGDDGAHSQDLLNEIARARLCLLNQEKKTAYDDQLREKRKAENEQERESRKPSAKGPPPKAPKRSVPPPAVPPSGASPPATVGPPSPSKSSGSPVSPFDPAALAALDRPPNKPRDTAPVKIVVENDRGKETNPVVSKDAPIQLHPKGRKTRRKQPIEPAVVKDVPFKPHPKGRKTEEPTPADPEVPNDTPVQPHRMSRGVLLAFALIAIVGLIGLALIIVMSVLLLTR